MVNEIKGKTLKANESIRFAFSLKFCPLVNLRFGFVDIPSIVPRSLLPITNSTEFEFPNRIKNNMYAYSKNAKKAGLGLFHTKRVEA